MTYRETVAAIERRVRRLSAAATAGVALLIPAAAAAVAAVAVALFTVSSTARLSVALAALGIPSVAAVLGFAFRMRRPSRLAQALLRVDVSLGLDARLSSLHEVAKTAPDSFIFRRLEADVSLRLDQWRKALPVSARTVATYATGATCVVLAVVLSTLLQPPHTTADPTDRESIAGEVRGADGHDEPTNPSVDGAIGDAPTTTGADDAADEAERRIDDVLADLGLEGAPADGGGDPGAVELGARDDAATFDALIASLHERLGASGAKLTIDEQNALREAATDAPAPVRQAIEDVLSASSDAERREALETLVASVETPRDASQDEPVASSRVSTEQEPDDEAATIAGDQLLAGLEEESAGGIPPALEGDAAEDATREARTPGSEDAEAGDEGPPVPAEEDSGERAPGSYVLERTPTAIGDDGEVKSYLTTGVPLEFAEEGTATSARVSYEQIESIVAMRELSPEAALIVRTYFEAITEGGS